MKADGDAERAPSLVPFYLLLFRSRDLGTYFFRNALGARRVFLSPLALYLSPPSQNVPFLQACSLFAGVFLNMYPRAFSSSSSFFSYVFCLLSFSFHPPPRALRNTQNKHDQYQHGTSAGSCCLRNFFSCCAVSLRAVRSPAGSNVTWPVPFASSPATDASPPLTTPFLFHPANFLSRFL